MCIHVFKIKSQYHAANESTFPVAGLQLQSKVMVYLKNGNVYEYLIISANMERSGLYLKLFKLVFGSVSLLAAENEQMLKVTLPFTWYLWL